jgi:deazaflavin-dependent oxidoreductase (nitroreductase family)
MSEDDFNTQVIEEFRAAGGSAESVGEMPLLLLHHVGVRSGLPRVSPLAFVQDAGRYVLLASGGGRATNPAWYANLVARGRATIEVGAETIEVEAQEAVGEERDRLFGVLVERVPEFAEYLDMTDRVMPVVLLRPTECS